MFEVYKAGTDNLLTITDAECDAKGVYVFRATVRGTESDAEHTLTWRCGALYPLTTDSDLRDDVIESAAMDVGLATEDYTVPLDTRELIGLLADELGMFGVEAYDAAVALTEMGLWYARLTPSERTELERLAITD